MRRPPAFASRLARREMFRCGISSGPPDSLEFVGRHVHAKAPAGNVSRPLVAASGRARRMSRVSGMAEAIQFFRRADLVQIEQVTEPPDDSTSPQAKCVVDQPTRFHVVAPHPEALCDLGDSAAVRRQMQAVDHGSLNVAHLHGILFRNPVRRDTEHIFLPNENKSKLRAMDGPVPTGASSCW